MSNVENFPAAEAAVIVAIDRKPIIDFQGRMRVRSYVNLHAAKPTTQFSALAFFMSAALSACQGGGRARIKAGDAERIAKIADSYALFEPAARIRALEGRDVRIFVGGRVHEDLNTLLEEIRTSLTPAL